jgi:hypothetical protein
VYVNVAAYSGINVGTTTSEIFGTVSSGTDFAQFFYTDYTSTTLLPVTQAQILSAGYLNFTVIYPI